MEELVYDNLDSEQLAHTLMQNDECVVTLTPVRGKRCAALISNLNKTMGYDKDAYSIPSRMAFLLAGLLEVARDLIFHPKLFEIFMFYYQHNPFLQISELSAEKWVLTFRRKSQNVENKSMGSDSNAT